MIMTIITSDGKRSVDIGTNDIWNSIYFTAADAFGMQKSKIKRAVEFMERGLCAGEDAIETARQFNLIRDRFASIPPEKLIYDIRDKKKKAPWDGNISPVVTSCANLFTTADGKDLLHEVVSILTYAYYSGVDVTMAQ